MKENFVLLDFHADWCGPCITMEPILEEIEEEFKEILKVVKVDVDQHKAMAIRFKIKSVPTLILFKDNEQIWRKSGLLSKRDLREMLSENDII